MVDTVIGPAFFVVAVVYNVIFIVSVGVVDVFKGLLVGMAVFVVAVVIDVIFIVSFVLQDSVLTFIYIFRMPSMAVS